MSENKDDAVALAQLQVQMSYVMRGIDEIKQSLKTDLADLQRRVAALELELATTKASQTATATTTVATSKAWLAVIGGLGAVIWTCIQVVAKKLGWL